MDNQRSNARDQQADRPRVDKIVDGNVKIAKKKGFSKFLSSFVGEEIDDIKTHVVSDLIIPTIKDVLLDTLSMMLGMGRYSGGRRTRTIAERTAYGRFFDEPRNKESRTTTYKAFDTDEIVFGNRGDAEQVLDRMFEILEQYGVARVTDLYDMAGLSVDYTAGKYGWTSLRNARVERVSGGYILDLPRALPIG